MCNQVLLKQKLAEKGLSQRRLADMAQVSHVTIGRICSGKSDPRLSTLILIVDVLELNINEFIEIFFDELVKKYT